MARKAKPPADAPVFSAAKWASLAEAFDWAEGALGSTSLAEDDLTAHFRSGQLPLARWRRSGGVGTLELLEPSVREKLHVVEAEYDGVLLVRVWGLPPEIASSDFFVERGPLENLYSPGPALEPASDAPAMASDAPTRRKPGPRIKKNWKLHIAVELHRIVIIERKLPPTAKDLAEFCVRKLNHHPDISEIQKLIKDLL
jgi:hypothetical protein